MLGQGPTYTEHVGWALAQHFWSQRRSRPDFQGGIWAFVDIDLSKISGKAKRVNITLPERILNLIDLYGKSHPVKNRSAFLTDAALCYMEIHK